MRSAVAGLAVATAAVVVAGCGGGGDRPAKQPAKPQRPIDVVRAAAERTKDAGGARITGAFRITAPEISISLPINGAVNFGLGRVRWRVERPAARAAVRRRFPQFPEEQIDMGTLMWRRSPTIARDLPAGKRWIAVDNDVVRRAYGLDPDRAAAADPRDATRLVTFLRPGDVVEIGPERVGGERMTRYHATLDLRRGLRPGARSPRAVSVFLRDAGLASRVPLDLWIDRRGLIRSHRLAVPMDAGEHGTETFAYSGFGLGVTIAPPPIRQVLFATPEVARAVRQSVAR